MVKVTREHLDDQLLSKLVEAMGRKWGGASDLEPRVDGLSEAISAYAAMRQVELLKSIHEQLSQIEPALQRLNETIMCLQPDLELNEEGEHDL